MRIQLNLSVSTKYSPRQLSVSESTEVQKAESSSCTPTVANGRTCDATMYNVGQLTRGIERDGGEATTHTVRVFNWKVAWRGVRVLSQCFMCSIAIQHWPYDSRMTWETKTHSDHQTKSAARCGSPKFANFFWREAVRPLRSSNCPSWIAYASVIRVCVASVPVSKAGCLTHFIVLGTYHLPIIALC